MGNPLSAPKSTVSRLSFDVVNVRFSSRRGYEEENNCASRVEVRRNEKVTDAGFGVLLFVFRPRDGTAGLLMYVVECWRYAVIKIVTPPYVSKTTGISRSSGVDLPKKCDHRRLDDAIKKRNICKTCKVNFAVFNDGTHSVSWSITNYRRAWISTFKLFPNSATSRVVLGQA